MSGEGLETVLQYLWLGIAAVVFLAGFVTGVITTLIFVFLRKRP